MDLAYVKAAVSDINPYYADLLIWEQQHGIIKAIPKKRLSDSAHSSISKVFQKLGGQYVGHAGQAWFELVVLEESVGQHADSPQGQEDSACIAHNPSSIPQEPGILRQLEARILSLRRAAQTLLEA